MFITFEGVEGSGKSTALAGIARYLEEQGHQCLCTREPGGCHLGQELRSILLDASTRSLDPTAELFLFLADRVQHEREVILPALNSGKMVLCDRYVDSTFAYQCYGRGFDMATLRHIQDTAIGNIQPALTLLFDLPIEEGLRRARARNSAQGMTLSEGRFEAELLEFHERVRKGYLEIAREEPYRVTVIDATKSPEDVLKQCIEAVSVIVSPPKS